MKIKEYMEINKLSHREFAKLIGTSPATIFHFLNGKTKTLSFPVIQKIVNGTKGRITLKDITEEIEAKKLQ